MKKTLFLLLLTMLPAALRAQGVTGGDVAIVAGASAAAAVLGPAVATALTKSHVEVTVEAYRDTYPIRPPNLSWEKWCQLPLDQQRTAPFYLGDATALHKLIQRSAGSETFTLPKAQEVADRLAGSQWDFQATGERLGNILVLISQWTNGEPSLITDFQPVIDDFVQRSNAAQAVVRSIAAFRTSLSPPGTYSPLLSSNLLEQVRNELRAFPAGFKPRSAELFEHMLTTTIESNATVKSAVLAGQSTNLDLNILNRAKIQTAVDAPLFPSIADPTVQIATSLSAALDLVRELERSSNYVVRGDFKIEMDSSGVREGIDQTLYLYGFLFKSKDILDITTPDALVDVICRKYLPQQTAEAAQQALALTCYGLNVGANFGPIVNEVFQGIFARSRMIDTVLSDSPAGHSSRWVRMNYAKSSGGAGDHNAVIYLDNLLSPVLKSASFDPSQFIAANAKLYRRTVSVMADAFGVPKPTTGGDSTAAAATPSFNFYDAQARVINANKTTDAQAAALRQTLKDLIDLGTAYQSDLDTNGVWKTAAAGTNRITAARLKLNQFALNLQNLKSN